MDAKKIKLACLILFGIITLNACKKGDTGPAGANGTNGGSNVLIKTYTLYSSDWKTFTGTYPNNVMDTVFISVPEITQGILDSGMVLIYIQNGDKYEMLPQTAYYAITEWTYQPLYGLGFAAINYTSNDNGPPAIISPLNVEVVIQSGHH